MNRNTFIKSLSAFVLGGVLGAGILGFLPIDSVEGKGEIPSNKALIVCFSWSGNTKALAGKIQLETGAELIEIVPETAYPKDYSKCVQQAKKEIEQKYRPALKAFPKNLADYDVIFVGSPNWWGTYAPPVATFLDKPELAGKKIVPFFTHGGGGLQNCERDMRKQCSKAQVLEAFAVNGSSATSSSTTKRVAEWLVRLGLKKEN